MRKVFYNPTYSTCRSDKSRPGDVVWLGFSGVGRHLVVGGSIVMPFLLTLRPALARKLLAVMPPPAKRTRKWLPMLLPLPL